VKAITQRLITSPAAEPLQRLAGKPWSLDEAADSPDYAAVVWRGQRYTFSRKQRRAVALLFQAKDDGYNYVSQEMLLDAAESDQLRLRELFRDHPCWGTMIVSGLEDGGRQGTYRISP
jgi:hypothetical protein